MGLVELTMAELLAKLQVIAAAALGSFISLKFFEGLNLWERWSTFLAGMGLATVSAPALVSWFELKPAVEPGLSMAVGIFGMSIVAALIRVIREVNWSELVKGIINRKTGGGA